MNIMRLGHFVLTTDSLPDCLHFYAEILGMEVVEQNGRYALHFGQQKINIHRRKAEFLPAAQYPQPGSLDLCFVVDTPIAEVRQELLKKGVALEQDIVERTGALGIMQSIYLRDPDGNLIELCRYKNEK